MKIYLAGSCDSSRRIYMASAAKALREEGFDVYAPFELKIENAWDMTQEEWANKVFDIDTQAIENADFVVVISPGRKSTAGTNWEQGYAYAIGKLVLVLQYSNKPTSLMTYCGCDSFVSIQDYCVDDYMSFAEVVTEKVLDFVNKKHKSEYKYISTILT